MKYLCFEIMMSSSSLSHRVTVASKAVKLKSGVGMGQYPGLGKTTVTQGNQGTRQKIMTEMLRLAQLLGDDQLLIFQSVIFVTRCGTLICVGGCPTSAKTMGSHLAVIAQTAARRALVPAESFRAENRISTFVYLFLDSLPIVALTPGQNSL